MFESSRARLPGPPSAQAGVPADSVADAFERIVAGLRRGTARPGAADSTWADSMWADSMWADFLRADATWEDGRTAVGPSAGVAGASDPSALDPNAPGVSAPDANGPDASALVFGAPDDGDLGLASSLGTTAPGPALAALLAGVVAGDVADHVLVEVVAACARLSGWAASVQASAAAELATRRAWSSEREHLGDELGLVLGHAAVVGRTLVARGEALESLPEVRDALRNGVVDVGKADVLAFTGVFAHPEDRRAATARVLPEAPGLGLRALRRRMLAEAVACCPEAVETNRKAAVAERYVRLEPVENSMAYLSVYLPAVDAAAVWSALDDAAHQVSRTPGEARTLAQARADVLVGLATGRVLPATTTSGDAGGPACAGTSGGAPAGMPGAGMPGGAPGVASTVAPATPGGAAGRGPCGSCGAPVGGQGFTLRVVPTRPVVRVAVAAGTLLGLDDAPAHLTGYGPVPAEVARVLAEDATWQRLITDPRTGILTDYSTTAYAPGAVLRRAIEARDATCTFPLCDRPAERCDLDHLDPFDHRREARDRRTGSEPGQTRAGNLHALCRGHHRAKTHGVWTVARDPGTGTTTWTSPSGRTFARTAVPADPAHRHQHQHQHQHRTRSLGEDLRGAVPAPEDPPF